MLGKIINNWKNYISDLVEQEQLRNQLVDSLRKNDKLVWKKIDEGFMCNTQEPHQKFILKGSKESPTLIVDTDVFQGEIEGESVSYLWGTVESKLRRSDADGLKSLIDSLK